jgi:GDPmannose 4,6-dehydratase
MNALITGIAGQDGSYAAELLTSLGYRVTGLIRPGSKNLQRIEPIRDRIDLIEVDLLDEERLRSVIEQCKPTEIYNFAARASSSHLFEKPVMTAEYNAVAVLRLLEIVRNFDAGIRVCQACSSEIFGNAEQSPQNELTPARPRNPYGVAKLFAHGIVGVYRNTYGVFACSSLLFNHESPRRGEELVTRRISRGVARIKLGIERTLKLANLDGMRDWGFAGDYVQAMWQMLQAPRADDYVIATGQSHSVRDFCDIAFTHVGLDYRHHVALDPSTARVTDAVRLVGDSTKARSVLGWKPRVSFEELVCMMVDADIESLQQSAEPKRHN